VTLDIEHQLQVAAPREAVLRFLLDPEKVVTCLPGAELLEVVDPRHFVGRVKVKVGPITVAYKGKARLTEVDEAGGLIRMEGEGAEQTGSGSARVTMDCVVSEPTPGVTEVRVVAKLDLVGRVVQLGRGMIKGVAEQVFKQFAAALRERLEVPPGVPTTVPPLEAAGAPVSPAGAPPPASASPASAGVAASLASVAPSSTGSLATPVRVRTEVRPVSGLGLLARALFEPILRFFRRLFRRRDG